MSRAVRPTTLLSADEGRRARSRGHLAAGSLVLGKLRIETVLGEGGMAVVYAARHELLDLPVALKVLHPEQATEEAMSRFFHEAKIVARIRSEHVCSILDVGRLEEGTPYILMDLLEGLTLDELVERRGPCTVPETIELALQALEGIACAHAVGVVHRDLKPKNLFVSRGAVVKVLDFGVSKSMMLTDLTHAGSFLGSPTYASPEQITAPLSVDVRTDIWSFGIVLYEMLTGTVPFDGDSVDVLMLNILHEEPVPLVHPSVPPELAAVVMRCLTKPREERWADTFELARALAPFALDPTGAAERLRRIALATGRLPAAATIDVKRESWAHLDDDTVPSGPPDPEQHLQSGMRRMAMTARMPSSSRPPPAPTAFTTTRRQRRDFSADLRVWRAMAVALAIVATLLACVSLFAVHRARHAAPVPLAPATAPTH